MGGGEREMRGKGREMKRGRLGKSVGGGSNRKGTERDEVLGGKFIDIEKPKI